MRCLNNSILIEGVKSSRFFQYTEKILKTLHTRWESSRWMPSLRACPALLQTQGPARAEQRFNYHFRSLQMYHKHVSQNWQRSTNLPHSWRSGPVTDYSAPDCPLLLTTGPRSCSRCTASTQSDSRWGPGPRCSYGSDWPLWTDITCTGPNNVNSWPWLLPPWPSSVTCTWSQNLKNRKSH